MIEHEKKFIPSVHQAIAFWDRHRASFSVELFQIEQFYLGSCRLRKQSLFHVMPGPTVDAALKAPTALVRHVSTHKFTIPDKTYLLEVEGTIPESTFELAKIEFRPPLLTKIRMEYSIGWIQDEKWMLDILFDQTGFPDFAILEGETTNEIAPGNIPSFFEQLDAQPVPDERTKDFTNKKLVDPEWRAKMRGTPL